MEMSEGGGVSSARRQVEGGLRGARNLEIQAWSKGASRADPEERAWEEHPEYGPGP